MGRVDKIAQELKTETNRGWNHHAHDRLTFLVTSMYTTKTENCERLKGQMGIERIRSLLKVFLCINYYFCSYKLCVNDIGVSSCYCTTDELSNVHKPHQH